MDEHTTEKDAAEPKYVLFHIGDGWSALYINGVLDQIGDSYNVAERIEALLGVRTQESEVMAAVQRRADAPSTLAELRSMEAERRRLLDEAEGLRRQAAALAAEADALTGRVLPPGDGTMSGRRTR